MIEIRRGFRSEIEGFVSEKKNITIGTMFSGTGKCSYSCYCACGDNKLPDKRCKIFQSQRQTPNNEVI